MITSCLWVILSDRVLVALLDDRVELLTTLQTIKGWLFILLSTAVMYRLIKREFDVRQRTVAEIQEREAHARALFAANPVPMWIYSRETLAFLDVNAAACVHYGYSRDEFLSMKITDIRPPDEIPRFLEYLKRSDVQFNELVEWRHLTKDGREITVEASAYSFEYEEERALLVAIRDITERRRGEAERLESEKLRLLLSKEIEMKAIRSRFISMVSHEFRRPLTTITTSIELLEHYRSKMTDDAATRHFARIHEQLDEARELLDDFLALMRTEAAEQDFKPAPIELVSFCRNLVETHQLSTNEHHTLNFEPEVESFILPADERLLRHALGNLLSNAIKYSPEGGEVHLHVWQDGEANVRLQVSDQGIGIPKEAQEQIFTPFYRAKNVSDISGTGLGLSIAKQAVELHGGTLDLVKSDTSGTVFLITLPANDSTSLTGC